MPHNIADAAILLPASSRKTPVGIEVIAYNGCNFEMFSNSRMLELESLGPLTNLPYRQTVEHIERWELHNGPPSLDATHPEEQLDEFLRPVLKKNVSLQSQLK